MPIRLAGAQSENTGRVEIYHEGLWGTICDDSWDQVDADVVCRQLGFSQGAVRAAVQAEFGAGINTILLTDVNCYGSEQTLEDCKKSEWGENSCEHSQDSGVVCINQLGKTGIHIHKSSETALKQDTNLLIFLKEMNSVSCNAHFWLFRYANKMLNHIVLFFEKKCKIFFAFYFLSDRT